MATATDDGKSKGGTARAESLSPERRAEIASTAAAVRWAKPGAKVPHTLRALENRLEAATIAVGGLKATIRAVEKELAKLDAALANAQAALLDAE